ncbi:RBK1 [[Candida] subhashii]|uniref:RBK1 n=1 Tax=[Candida] subhashii TaxID=561895 RepID=A0A8J5QLI6_9ASCO|nr:RBK1 [[Candida] subhashii]KAG7662786.1 RBK1 [[Candida] subhashii]
MVGKIGNDDFGTSLRQYLIESEVDVRWVEVVEEEGVGSGVATILVEEETGENRILITSGANGYLKPSEEEYREYFGKREDGEREFVILQNEYPDTISSIDWIKGNRPHVRICYNPSPFDPELIDLEMLGKLDMLIVNEGEAMDVAKCVLGSSELKKFETEIENDEVKGFKELAEKLQSLINDKNEGYVIITLGSKGVVYVSQELESPKFEPARKVKNVVDTTGAGDTFFGGVVSSLARGISIEHAVRFATAASSLAVQKRGAAEGIPMFEDVFNIIDDNDKSLLK